MFTDEQRRNAWDRIRQCDLRAFNSLLTPDLLQEAVVRAGLAGGHGPLCLANLAWLSIASALHVTRNFAEVLVITLKLLSDADSSAREPLAPYGCKQHPKRPGRRGRGPNKPSPHDPRREPGQPPTEEAFTQARKKAPIAYWTWLILLLGEKFRARHAERLCCGGHRLLALDGTTLKLPNRKELREHFGVHRGRRGSAAQPEARMVMLTFPLVRMPFKYELCPLSHSEKTCAASLLCGLEAGDLVLMDRGFWSYGLFRQIASQQAFFAIRLFGGAKLRTLRTFARDDRLMRYAPTDRKWKKLDLPRSMDLRVIRYRMAGFRPSAVVTNLTDRRLPGDYWVGLATRKETGPTLEGGVYHRRWEIETTFCELKVRQKMEGSLRGRTPEAIAYEVAGHVLLYLLVRWLMAEAAADRGLDPLRLSYLCALRELTDMTPALLTSDACRVRRVLVPRLLARIACHIVPPRPGRHYPRPGDTKVKYKGRGHYSRPSKLKAGKA